MGIIINGICPGFTSPIIHGIQPYGSPNEILEREGHKLKVSANITGNNNSYNVNVFKITGTVRVIDQFAIITSVTALSNMTAIYADLWDGTNSELLTANGAVLSGAPVGTFFTKDQDVTQTYSVSKSDQCRVNEVAADKRIGKPFTVTQKYGANTYIRFNYTTNTVLDFDMDIYFVYEPMDGSGLEVA